MSEENVERTQRAWAFWSAGDIDANLNLLGPEIVWDMSHFVGWPENPVYRGTEAVRRFYEEWLDAWDEYEAGVERFIDAGDAVVAVCWQRGKPRGAAIFVEMKFAQVITREGTATRVMNYSDITEALEAAGLSE